MENNSSRNRSDSIELAYRKLFIGGLSYSTDEEKLRKYFETYGAVQDAVVMKDPISKRSRGFGFITFTDASGVDSTLAKEPHTIDSRKVEAKRAVPRSEISKLDGHANRGTPPQPTKSQPPSNKNGQRGYNAGSPSKSVVDTNTNAKSATHDSPGRGPHEDYSYNKIFVGGLHYDTKDAEFRLYFEKYGKVISAEVMFNRETHKSRGFGFIVFDAEESAVRVSAKDDHFIDEKQVEVKRAIPRSKLNPSSSSSAAPSSLSLTGGSLNSSGIASPSRSSKQHGSGPPAGSSSSHKQNQNAPGSTHPSLLGTLPSHISLSKGASLSGNSSNNNNNIRSDVRRAMSSSLPSSSQPNKMHNNSSSNNNNKTNGNTKPASNFKINGVSNPASIWKTAPSGAGHSVLGHWSTPGSASPSPVKTGAGSSPSYAAALGVGREGTGAMGFDDIFKDSMLLNTMGEDAGDISIPTAIESTKNSPGHNASSVNPLNQHCNSNASGVSSSGIFAVNTPPRKRSGSFQIPLVHGDQRSELSSTGPLSLLLAPLSETSIPLEADLALNNLRYRSYSEPNVFSQSYNTLNFMINSSAANQTISGSGSGSRDSRDSMAGLGPDISPDRLGMQSLLRVNSQQSLVTLGGTPINIPNDNGFNGTRSRGYSFKNGFSDGLDGMSSFSEELPQSRSFPDSSPSLAGLDWLSSPLTNPLPEPPSPRGSGSRSGSFAGSSSSLSLPPPSNVAVCGSPGRGAVPTLDAWANVISTSAPPNPNANSKGGSPSKDQATHTQQQVFPQENQFPSLMQSLQSQFGSSSGGGSATRSTGGGWNGIGPEVLVGKDVPSTSLMFMNTSNGSTSEVDSRDDRDTFNTSVDAIKLNELNFNSPVFVPTKP